MEEKKLGARTRTDQEVLAILKGKNDAERGEVIRAYREEWDLYVRSEFSTIPEGDCKEIVGKMVKRISDRSWIARDRQKGSFDAFLYQSLRSLCLDFCSLAILKGEDETKRGEIIQAYRKKWDRYVRSKFSRILEGHREEIVGKMCERILDQSWLAHYRFQGPLDAFLYQSLYYLCLDRVRKPPDINGDDAISAIGDGADPNNDILSPFQALSYKQLRQLLDQLLDRFTATLADSEKAKRAILKILLEEKKPQQVASEEDMTANAVRVLKTKLLKLLRSDPLLLEWWFNVTGKPFLDETGQVPAE
ncbi:MAG: hypothetical protein HYZ50_20045 [Deltaproteobacteria bacterium]|nr:hypothetical protein [Deltaproteobacteria bacterium]